MIFACAALSLGLLAGLGRAEAVPAPTLATSAGKASPIQNAYYRRWYRGGYYPGYAYRPYGYRYRPYGYYGYGYRPYGYGYRRWGY